jgi:hypothetical protein
VRITKRKFSSLVFDSGFWLFLGLKHVHRLVVTYHHLKSIVGHAKTSAENTDALRYHAWQMNHLLRQRGVSPRKVILPPPSNPLMQAAQSGKVGTVSGRLHHETKTHRFERRIQSYYNKSKFLNERSPFARQERDARTRQDLVDSHRSELHRIRRDHASAFDAIDFNVSKSRARNILYRTSMDASGIV